jgi:hypothetical protein
MADSNDSDLSVDKHRFTEMPETMVAAHKMLDEMHTAWLHMFENKDLHGGQMLALLALDIGKRIGAAVRVYPQHRAGIIETVHRNITLGEQLEHEACAQEDNGNVGTA